MSLTHAHAHAHHSLTDDVNATCTRDHPHSHPPTPYTTETSRPAAESATDDTSGIDQAEMTVVDRRSLKPGSRCERTWQEHDERPSPSEESQHEPMSAS